MGGLSPIPTTAPSKRSGRRGLLCERSVRRQRLDPMVEFFGRDTAGELRVAHASCRKWPRMIQSACNAPLIALPSYDPLEDLETTRGIAGASDWSRFAQPWATHRTGPRAARPVQENASFFVLFPFPAERSLSARCVPDPSCDCSWNLR